MAEAEDYRREKGRSLQSALVETLSVSHHWLVYSGELVLLSMVLVCVLNS